MTEEYPPNVSLVRERLEPLSVRVVEARLTDVDPLPFAAGEFDLVVPWLVPGFSVASHLPHLLRLQARLDSGRELGFSARPYLIEAVGRGAVAGL